MTIATALKGKRSNKPAAAVPAANGGQGSMDMGMSSRGARKLGGIDIPEHYFNRFTTGVKVMDDLINGDGLVPGQCFTLDAPRGGGKTTLLLQLMQGIITYNDGFKRCLYLSGEEYVEQLAYMAQRIDTPDVEADNVVEADEIVKLTEHYDVMVIDSLASVKHEGLRSRQSIEEYAVNEIIKAAKTNKCAVFFIQHQTKNQVAKGNSNIQHSVDTCLKIHNMDPEAFGGSNVKCISVDKNRFGGAGDVILRLNRNGWDFDNPIDNATNNDGNKTANSRGGAQAAKKTADMTALVDKINELDKQGKQAKIADLAPVVGDVGRTERLLKELAQYGKVSKVGRAAKAVYKVV
jgi:predicted ATP-dependent serine protease